MKNLQHKLSKLPSEPGVYLYKDKTGAIIYVGKAAILKNRVRQYFQKSRVYDAKTEALVADIDDIDWITVETELDALFLEAELVRRYMPRYNILLRDDKSTIYIRIDIDSQHPTVTTSRRPIDDKAEYFGPYFNAHVIKRALNQLRKVFPYSTHLHTVPKRACLQVHIGLCPGLEEGKTSLEEYRTNLRKLIQYIRGSRTAIIKELESNMKLAAVLKDFETAAKNRNQLYAIKSLSKQIIFSDKEFLDISKDEALFDLCKLLGLKTPPRRIEGYDISHMSGTDTVASMVVFSNGIPEKTAYRKFKSRIKGNDDFKHMGEVITRRFSVNNLKAWPKPNLILIDGGKGQLQAALDAAQAANISLPMIGLAKREEEIVVSKKSALKLDIPSGAIVKETSDFTTIILPKSSHLVKLLQRIRDESHRFAVSYHTVLKRNRQTSSVLDEVPTIGPVTRRKLLKSFGSSGNILKAGQADIAKVVGVKKAAVIHQYVHSLDKKQL